MEIVDNNTIFETDFKTYKTKFDELKELAEDDFPKSLRLFDIRFRLALSLQIGFDSSVSYTKTETTRKTYNLILRLNDIWFAYEGLYKLCSDNSNLKSNPTKSDPFTAEKITEFMLDDKVKRFGNYLNKEIYQNTRLKNDFVNYLQYLKDNSTGKTQQRLLESFRKKVNNNRLPKFNEIMSVIYGMRNMYVHNTDTAKSGVSQYKTKIEILKNCNDFLTLVLLNISIKTLNKMIEDIE
jgi:hypothetical protein